MSKQYNICRRLIKAINRAFPTAHVDKAERAIMEYRRGRDANTTDWEGQRAYFKRVIQISFKNRHVKKEPKVMNAWAFLRNLHEVCSFQTREGKKTGKASSSELKRWIQNKALLINGETVTPDEKLDFPIFSVVLFPKNPITLL